MNLPYGKFKAKLESKCLMYGIKYQLVSEAYTSRTDALAFDEIKEQPYGKKRRVKRGLYESITGVLINADVNGGWSPHYALFLLGTANIIIISPIVQI